MHFALVNFYAQCKLHSAECSLHWRVWMPNVKCILPDAPYIGVFLGTSIFGHVENAFFKIFFCFLLQHWTADFALDLGLWGWILDSQCEIFEENICREISGDKKKKTLAEKLLDNIFLKNIARETSGETIFEENICKETSGYVFLKKLLAEKLLEKKYEKKAFAKKLLEKKPSKKAFAEKLLEKKTEEHFCRKTSGEKFSNLIFFRENFWRKHLRKT